MKNCAFGLTPKRTMLREKCGNGTKKCVVHQWMIWSFGNQKPAAVTLTVKFSIKFLVLTAAMTHVCIPACQNVTRGTLALHSQFLKKWEGRSCYLCILPFKYVMLCCFPNSTYGNDTPCVNQGLNS